MIQNSLGRPVLQLAPFFDIGRSWDKGGAFRERGDESMKTLSSLGVGLRYAPSERMLAEIYWGGALRSVPDRGNGLQNYGVHFRLTARSW